MSRAFVRDEDTALPEPPPELVISEHRNLVTARGLTLIEARLAGIEAELAIGPDEARAELLRRDQRYWRQRRASAEVTAAPDDEDEIGFGSRVTISRDGGPDEGIEIVGEDEADPAQGRIFYMAPLAVALRGAEIGECSGGWHAGDRDHRGGQFPGLTEMEFRDRDVFDWRFAERHFVIFIETYFYRHGRRNPSSCLKGRNDCTTLGGELFLQFPPDG